MKLGLPDLGYKHLDGYFLCCHLTVIQIFAAQISSKQIPLILLPHFRQAAVFEHVLK